MIEEIGKEPFNICVVGRLNPPNIVHEEAGGVAMHVMELLIWKLADINGVRGGGL